MKCATCNAETLRLESDVDGSVEYVCQEHGAQERDVVLLVSGNLAPHELRTNERGDTLCPVCGHDDLSLWAHDGEADLADWWDCQTSMGGCGASGALVFSDDLSRTQNRVSVAQEALRAQLGLSDDHCVGCELGDASPDMHDYGYGCEYGAGAE